MLNSLLRQVWMYDLLLGECATWEGLRYEEIWRHIWEQQNIIA
jgi:hypothetical protein